MSVGMGLENEAKGGDVAEKRDKLNDDDDDDESEDEEVGSLCEYNEVEEMGEPAASDDPVSTLRPQQQADLFEFFTSNNTLDSEMCPADDIIVSGKLLPLKNQCLSNFPHQTAGSRHDGGRAATPQRQNARCRRSESLSRLKSTSQSNSNKARVEWSGRTLLDDTRHGRCHSSWLDRNSSGISDISSVSSPKLLKSRWQLLIFGMGTVKFPPDMESEARCPSSRSAVGWRGSSWDLLKALSCNDHTSISVTTSFVCTPPYLIQNSSHEYNASTAIITTTQVYMYITVCSIVNI